MKKYIKNTFAALSLMAVATGCGDFGDTNIDPEHLNDTNVDIQMIFTNAQHQSLGSDWDAWRNGMIYLSQWNQHIAAGGWWWEYGVNSYSNGYAASYWASALGSGDRGVIRDIQLVINRWKDDPANAQNLQIARIIRAYTFQRLTDLHGDIPYSQAGQPDLYPYPKYDKQSDIYHDLLKELDEAQEGLGNGETASMGSQELFYGGNIAKLKKFANSLMLRLAMRLSKVEPETAKAYVQKAYTNGVITETADNCMLMHKGGVSTNDTAEPYAKIISHEDQGVPFIHTTFMDILKETDDPRIPLIMAVYQKNEGDVKDVDPAKAEYSDPTIQKGLPGFFSMSKSSDYSIKYYYPEFTDDVLDSKSDKYFKRQYSQPNRSTYGDVTGPTFVCTAAQTNLLLAEAAYRGWISGDPKAFYAAGVRCAMEQFSAYTSTNATVLRNKYLTDPIITAYVAANPLVAGKELEMINTQYWITCFCDEYETYANWRRSGYPELQNPCKNLTNFKDLGNYGEMVRRFPYDAGELQSNGANYLEALGRMGLQNENDFNNTRVWWDKE